MVDIVIRKKEQFRQLWENTIKPKISKGLEGSPVLVRLTRETFTHSANPATAMA